MTDTKLKLIVKATLISFSFLQTIIISGCSWTKELKSELFSGTSYRIDGRSDEWKGKKMLDLKDEGMMVGIQNDAKNFYVCLMSSDGATEHRMAAAGMIVWIEPEHGKKFGIHYPLHINREPGAARNNIYGYHTEMEILGPKKNDVAKSLILTSEADYGITAAFHDSSGIAVLELKIPRQARELPYGIGSDTVVTMTFESGTIDLQSGQTHQSAMRGGGRHRHGGGSQNSDPPSGNETPSSSYSDNGRDNAEERSGSRTVSSGSTSVNIRVHLAK